MRFLRPHEGLHPAYPRPTPPLPCTPLPVMPAFAGIASLTFGSLGLLFSRRGGNWRLWSYRAAAWTLAPAMLFSAAAEWSRASVGGRYLRSKEIEIRDWARWERTEGWSFDEVLVGGGVAAVLGGMVRGRTVRIGWGRGVARFCVGTLAGLVALGALPLEGKEAAVERDRRAQAVAQTWAGDVDRVLLEEWKGKGLKEDEFYGMQRAVARMLAGSAAGTTQGGATGLGAVTGRNGGAVRVEGLAQTGMLSLQAGQGIDLDMTDPKPHMTELGPKMDRQYTARTNYGKQYASRADATQQLTAHLKELQELRKQHILEAELLWAKLAEKEAAMRDASFSVTPEETQQKIELNMSNSMHAGAWQRITTLDRAIADTRKQLLQLQAMGKGETWHAGLSDEARDVYPEMSINAATQHLQFLEQLRATLTFDIARAKREAERLRTSLPANVVKAGVGGHPDRALLDEAEQAVEAPEMLDRAHAAVSALLRELKGQDPGREEQVPKALDVLIGGAGDGKGKKS